VEEEAGLEPIKGKGERITGGRGSRWSRAVRRSTSPLPAGTTVVGSPVTATVVRAREPGDMGK
jgi:hypothetical protein